MLNLLSSRLQTLLLSVVVAVVLGLMLWPAVRDNAINVNQWGRPLGEPSVVYADCPECPSSVFHNATQFPFFRCTFCGLDLDAVELMNLSGR